jgi:hypothetical protein
MLATLAGLVGEIIEGDVRTWVAATSLLLAVYAIGLAAGRTVRNAMRLGAQIDDPEVQSRFARAILRDHLACVAVISLVVILQVVAA